MVGKPVASVAPGFSHGGNAKAGGAVRGRPPQPFEYGSAATCRSCCPASKLQLRTNGSFRHNCTGAPADFNCKSPCAH